MNRPFIAPICISSPVRRSGTTLLQRLLCSASNTLIYGEDCANDLNFFQNLLFNKQLLFNNHKAWYQQQLEEVLEGKVNNWIPNLMPNIDGYLEAYKKAIVSILQYYADFAKQQNRPIWGMKFPEWNPSALLQVQRLFPGTKIIYIHRNLEDCVRSAKRIDMIKGLEEIRQFCSIAQQFSDYARQHLIGANVLHIEYQDLIQAPELILQNIETFTGAQHIDPTILDTKVNTYKNDSNLKPEDSYSYLRPSELLPEELEIVHSFSKKQQLAS